jgi:hypothetical protein
MIRDQIDFLKSVGATDSVAAELAWALNQVRTKSRATMAYVLTLALVAIRPVSFTRVCAR